MTVKALLDDMTEAYKQAKAAVRRVHQKAQDANTRFANPQSVYYFYDLVADLKNHRDLIDTLFTRALASENKAQVIAHIRAVENDPAYDPETEFAALITGIDSVINETITAVPKDTGGKIQAESFVDGVRVGDMLAAPAPLTAAISDLIAHIE